MPQKLFIPSGAFATPLTRAPSADIRAERKLIGSYSVAPGFSFLSDWYDTFRLWRIKTLERCVIWSPITPVLPFWRLKRVESTLAKLRFYGQHRLLHMRLSYVVLPSIKVFLRRQKEVLIELFFKFLLFNCKNRYKIGGEERTTRSRSSSKADQ